MKQRGRGRSGAAGFRAELMDAWADLDPSALDPSVLDPSVVDRLVRHRDQLERWRHYTALVSSAEATELVSRHYVESLVGQKLLPRAPSTLVDLGSGQGFPGLVLAACWPETPVVLVEPRAKKVAFLRQAAQAMGLTRVRVEARRFESTSAHQWWPDEVDLVTLRALRLSPSQWRWLRDTLLDRASIMRWETPSQEMPAGWSRKGRVPFPGDHHRAVSLFR